MTGVGEGGKRTRLGVVEGVITLRHSAFIAIAVASGLLSFGVDFPIAMGKTYVSPSPQGPVQLIEEPVGAPIQVRAVFAIEGWKITGIELVIINKTKDPVVIDWDRCALILPPSRAERIIHTGVRFLEKAKPQAPTMVPPFTEVREAIWPANYIRWVKSWLANYIRWVKSWLGGSYWSKDPIEIKAGDLVRICLTWEVNQEKASGIWGYKFTPVTPVTSSFLIGTAVFPVYPTEEGWLYLLPWIKWGSLTTNLTGDISIGGLHLLLGLWKRYYKGPLSPGIKPYWGWGTAALILPYFEFGLSWFGNAGPFLSVGMFYILPYVEFLIRF